MPPLHSDLRSELERTIIAARDAAERAAAAALVTLAVEREAPWPTMEEPNRRLRRALRAKARQLGGGCQKVGMPLLVEEVAYQQWHRMLFARFLAENDLLMHPQGVPVSLAECSDLAPEEGAADGWELAARYAGSMLPGVFPQDEPTVQVRLAPEDRHALEALVQGLPAEVFTSDDGLGWVYQFWQSKKKKEVNASERKIEGADLAPVTQLFTEDYMVRFLLENTLGAWWAARHPDSPLLETFAYLRYREDGSPAAGTFPGWPDSVAEVTMMDPCGGSGHFLVVGWDMLRRMRMEEEGLSVEEAADAVLEDNIFGLEIDARCTQIATFALLLAAWKLSGYRPVPLPHIACSGIAVEGQLDDWLALANGDARARRSLTRLYDLFRQAPTLGSLIDPTHLPIDERLLSADYDEVAPLLERALTREQNGEDPASSVLGRVAKAVAQAAELLASRYTLVATNVPYLGRAQQGPVLQSYCEAHHPGAVADLAMAMLERCRSLVCEDGTYALVVPRTLWYLRSFQHLRQELLQEQAWLVLVDLGPGAFDTISGHVVQPVLQILLNRAPDVGHQIAAFSVSGRKGADAKASALAGTPCRTVGQHSQAERPGSKIRLSESSRSQSYLRDFARSVEGLSTGDAPRYIRFFWEQDPIPDEWTFYQAGPDETMLYGGCEQVILWCSGKGPLANNPGARIQGQSVWSRPGVLVCRMGRIRSALYMGGLYDKSCVVICPHDPDDVPAIWAYCASGAMEKGIRSIDTKVGAATSVAVEVPIDLAWWRRKAKEAGPLPSPLSAEPTQWLFTGQPDRSTEPLHVATARLLGYSWPQQGPDTLDPHADRGEIVCIPPVGTEPNASERLRALLSVAYGDAWSIGLEQRLLSEVDYGNSSLGEWLRDGFFAQHCRLFHNRPFIWHIWDGRKDGFSALVNYHRLDASTLDKLIYTYLGQWIEAQRAEQDRGVSAAEGRLVAALELQRKLEAIREGEPPYDIYVRWKPLSEQPIGWNPDLNDGVRLNIRPWVTAGVLRAKFTMHWKKDRGKNPDGSERINDLHYTRAQKLAARQKQGKAGQGHDAS